MTLRYNDDYLVIGVLMKKNLLLLPFLIISSLYAEKTNYFAIKDVKAWDVLNLREKSDHTSKKISGIPHNAQCVVSYGCGKDITLEAMGNMHEEEIKLFLSQSKENWCYVAYKNNVGWVNKKFLKESTAKCK